MIFRNMTREDLDEVTRLEESCFSMPWKRHDFEDILTNEDRIYLVAEEDGHILGGCMLTDLLGEGDISNVAVFEQYRGRNIATRLVEEIMKIGTNEKHITAFTLEVREHNLPAIRVYEKNGFISEGIRPDFYDKPKENAVIMWKR